MKNEEVTQENHKKYEEELGNLYDKIPTELMETVARIVTLELELQNVSDL